MSKSLFCLVVFSVISYFSVNAQYTLKDNDVVVVNGTITECATNSTDWGTGILIIPDILDGQNIKSIGPIAFSTKGITGLTLSEGIEEINAWAFSSNPIVEITFPSSLAIIKGGAFGHCSLTEVTLPDNAEYIGSGAFEYNSIDSVIIPRSVTFLGSNIFQQNSIKYVEFENNSNIRLIDEKCFYDGGYSSLTSIVLPVNAEPDFKGYKDLQGNIYNAGDVITDFTGVYYAVLPPHVLTSEDVTFKDGQIIDYSGSYTNIIIPAEIDGIDVNTIPANSFDYRMLVEVKIEEGITAIDYNAFADSHVKKLSLPNTLTAIHSGAFMNNSIDTLVIPNGVSVVGGSAFMNNALKYVEISESLTEINANVFENNLFDSITIPENITSISEYAFRSNSLVKLKIPETVTSIGKGAFEYNHLSAVFMHNLITSVGDFAFANNNIDTVTISGKLTEINMGLFENNVIDTVIIPENIQSISDNAFSGNSLQHVYIPNHVNYIGNKAFAGNPGLTIIELPDPVIKTGYTFSNWQNNSDSSMGTSISDFYVSYKALFTMNTYNVIFTSGDNGRLQGDTVQTVEYGKNATQVTGIANSGYYFVKWQNYVTGDSVTNRNPITLSKIISDTALVAIFAQDPISSVNERNNDRVCIYPNPVIDFLYVKSPTELNSVEIININGLRMYYNDEINSTSLKIDMNNFTKGTYYITVKGNNLYKADKLVVL